MYKKVTKVINSTGIHARPASALTLKAKEFESEITLKRLDKEDAKEISAKAIMRLMAAAIKQGETVEIAAEGADEQAAVDALVEMFEDGFSERE
jgi:Phosphotransferase System HPr (HPr) Family